MGAFEINATRINGMPKFVAALAALAALVAGILAQVDPIACVYRASLAFVLGWFGAAVWQVVVTGTTRTITLSSEVGSLPPEEPHDS